MSMKVYKTTDLNVNLSKSVSTFDWNQTNVALEAILDWCVGLMMNAVCEDEGSFS